MAKKMDPEEKAKVRERQNANLINLRERTPEEKRRIAKLGNLAQQQFKKKRKALKEIIETLGMSPANQLEKEKFQTMFPGVEVDGLTKDMMLVASMYNQSIGRGNVKAASFLRDTVGEKPDTTISGSITTEKIFVTKEDEQKVLQHIKEVLNDGSNGDR